MKKLGSDFVAEKYESKTFKVGDGSDLRNQSGKYAKRGTLAKYDRHEFSHPFVSSGSSTTGRITAKIFVSDENSKNWYFTVLLSFQEDKDDDKVVMRKPRVLPDLKESKTNLASRKKSIGQTEVAEKFSAIFVEKKYRRAKLYATRETPRSFLIGEPVTYVRNTTKNGNFHKDHYKNQFRVRNETTRFRQEGPMLGES